MGLRNVKVKPLRRTPPLLAKMVRAIREAFDDPDSHFPAPGAAAADPAS